MIANIPQVKLATAAYSSLTAGEGLIYTGGGLITCIALDPEIANCEMAVRDGAADGDLLGNISAATVGQTNSMTLGGGIGFNKGIYVQMSKNARPLIYYAKKA
jgi:hypothetical protein